MTSPTQQLVQTIFGLQALRQRDAAEQLAREQFGLEQARFVLQQGQDYRAAGAQQEQGLALLQSIRQSVTDPSVLMPHIDTLSRATGAPPDVISSIIQGTPTAAATTRNAAVSAGAQEVGPALNAEAYAGALTGENLGANALSGLHAQIFQGAQQFVSKLSPEEQQAFSQRVAERVGSGMTPGDAIADELFTRAPKADQNRAMEIAKGLAPNASAEIQASLARQNLALDISKQQFDESARTLQLDIMKSEAARQAAGKDPETLKKINDLLNEYDQALTEFTKSSTTLTQPGIIQKGQLINAIVDQLQRLSPQQFGPRGSTPLQKFAPGQAPATTSGFLNFLGKSGILP